MAGGWRMDDAGDGLSGWVVKLKGNEWNELESEPDLMAKAFLNLVMFTIHVSGGGEEPNGPNH